MTQNSIQILCTRPIPAPLVTEAAEAGIDIDELSFIETESIVSVEVQQEIELALTETANVVFTSMNAVEAVAVFVEDQQPDWRIFSIGTTTHKLVKDHFGEHSVTGTASDASALAELIAADDSIKELIFFCGDQRRDELPSILRNKGIDVNEIIVYQTIAVPHKIQKAYHGILFFSPSAVESFFRNNIPAAGAIFFAIGVTTANQIKKFTDNTIIISAEPGKENLVRTMMEYFT